MFMSKTHRSLASALLLVMLSGCTVFPGSHISTSDKNKVEEEQSEDNQNAYSSDINVYELTPQKVADYQVKQASAQANLELEDQLPLIRAHYVADEVVAMIQQEFNCEMDILIHQDPMSLSQPNSQFSESQN